MIFDFFIEDKVYYGSKYSKILQNIQNFAKNDNSVYLLGNCYGFTSENLFVLLVFFLFSEFICFILFIYWY